jgi:hypothetical protein
MAKPKTRPISNSSIEKAIDALASAGVDVGANERAIDIQVPDERTVNFEPDVDISELPDGGVDVNFDPNAPIDQSQIAFGDNLAEYIEENDLQVLSNELVASYESDKFSRKDWHDTYTKGLDMLGFKYEDRTQPFQGASGVIHPLLAESVTQFQAQAYKELLPPGGPVNTEIVGEITPESEQQARRVKDYMNYQITHVMKEYDPDMDQLLFYLPLSGSAFKKTYYDAALQRAVSKFVSSEDCVINYMASSLEDAIRITHVTKIDANTLRKQQVGGFYRDVEITSGSVSTADDIEDKIDELQGTSDGSAADDEHVLLEMHVNADVPGFEDQDGIKLPYIITIDQYSTKILSIRRNWNEQDPLKNRVDYFTHYKFLPGLGFYGFGLIHMLGGLSRTATSVLRQLIDAGTLANLPAGFKSRGMRIRDHDEPLQPGEFRDVDVTGQSIKESLLPLPYKEPSQVLFALLGFCVDAGKSFAAIADMKMGEGNEQNPVGTTLALLERGTKVMSAIHKRLHYAQGVEFNMLARCFKMFLPPEYPYMVRGGNKMIKQQDFDDRVDILPISNPNIFSMSQRVMLAQQQLQLATSNPQLHNIREAYRRVYQALDVDNIDALLKPDPNQPQPMSPAMENSLAMRGQQPKAFPQQNHTAHMNTHGEFVATRMVQINPQLYAMMEGHILEHIAILAAQQVEEETKEQTMQVQQMAQQAQQNPQMAQQVQMAAQELQTQKESRIAELESVMVAEMRKKEKEAMESNQDPLVRLKQQEIDLKAVEMTMKGEADDNKIMADIGIEAEKLDLERDKLKAALQQTVVKEGLNAIKESEQQTIDEIKENMQTLREDKKLRSTERVAAMNSRARSNGRSDKNNK